MFNFYNLCSGSSGNSSLLQTDNSKILIDAGGSAKRITEALSSVNVDIFSSGTSIILQLQNLESLFEYSRIASLKNTSLIFPTQIIFIFNNFFLQS